MYEQNQHFRMENKIKCIKYLYVAENAHEILSFIISAEIVIKNVFPSEREREFLAF